MHFTECGQLRVEGNAERITTYYRTAECIRFAKSIYENDGQTESVTFQQPDGTEHRIARPVKRRRDGSALPLCDVYNAQYGIAVSHDGSRFYVSRWEGGVFCFSTEDFSLLWKNTLGSVRHIYTTAGNEAVCCESHHHGLVALSPETGEICGKLPGAGKKFFRLDEGRFVTGIRRGAFHVYAFAGLEQLCRIRVSDILPDGEDWCFRNAWLSEGRICFDAFCGERTGVFEVEMDL